MILTQPKGETFHFTHEGHRIQSLVDERGYGMLISQLQLTEGNYLCQVYNLLEKHMLCENAYNSFTQKAISVGSDGICLQTCP